MAHKITNISRTTFKQAVPLTISFNDGFNKQTFTILPDDSIILAFIPKMAHQLQVKNMVHIEFVPNEMLHPTPIIPNPIVTIQATEIVEEIPPAEERKNKKKVNKTFEDTTIVNEEESDDLDEE